MPLPASPPVVGTADIAQAIRADAAPLVGIASRAVTDDDLTFLCALFTDIRSDELAVTGWPVEQQRAFLAEQFARQHRYYQTHFAGAAFLLLERADRPIGRLYARIHDRSLALIDISLVADERGKGIGGALLGRLTALADGAGLGMLLHVEPDNPARRLYARHGFLPQDESGFYVRMQRAARATEAA